MAQMGVVVVTTRSTFFAISRTVTRLGTRSPLLDQVTFPSRKNSLSRLGTGQGGEMGGARRVFPAVPPLSTVLSLPPNQSHRELDGSFRYAIPYPDANGAHVRPTGPVLRTRSEFFFFLLLPPTPTPERLSQTSHSLARTDPADHKKEPFFFFSFLLLVFFYNNNATALFVPRTTPSRVIKSVILRDCANISSFGRLLTYSDHGTKSWPQAPCFSPPPWPRGEPRKVNVRSADKDLNLAAASLSIRSTVRTSEARLIDCALCVVASGRWRLAPRSRVCTPVV